MARKSTSQPATRASNNRAESTEGFSSVGISGLNRFGAISRVYEEFLKELQGPQGMKNYREMADNCPIVGAIMFAALHLCRKVSFQFKPKDDSNEARKIADFMGSCIFDDMETSWPDTMSEIMTMLTFGWAFLEFRFKRRLGLSEPNFRPPTQSPIMASGPNGIGLPTSRFAPSRFDDGLVGFRSWSLRSQETMFMWEFDEDSKAVVMQQMAPPDYRIRRIPLVKGLHFRTQVSKNNPEGRPITRNAWIPYYMKKNLQIFEGIGVERDLAGYPIIQIEKPDARAGQFPPDIWNDKDPKMIQLLLTMQKIVKSVRADEQMGMVLPWWAKFTLASTGSRRKSETNSIIARYDQRIAMSMMADFIMLGHEAVGSKALAATKISLFTAALSSFLDTACSIIDRDAVLTMMRFNGMPLELAPTLIHGDVESVNIQELGEFISKIIGTGFNPLAGIDAQKAVMEAAKLPTTGVTGELTIPVGGNSGSSEEVGGEGDAKGGKKGDKGSKKKPPSDQVGDRNAAEHDRSPSRPVMPEETVTGTPDRLITN